MLTFVIEINGTFMCISMLLNLGANETRWGKVNLVRGQFK